MAYEGKPGRGGVWPNKSDNSQAPVFKGHFLAHRDIKAGERVDLALFQNTSANAQAPAYDVKVQDPWVKGEQREKRVEQARQVVQPRRAPVDTAEDFDDDIPF